MATTRDGRDADGGHSRFRAASFVVSGADYRAASQQTPADLANIRIDQRLNQQVPLDLEFKDENGKTVKLGDYFHSRAVR